MSRRKTWLVGVMQPSIALSAPCVGITRSPCRPPPATLTCARVEWITHFSIPNYLARDVAEYNSGAWQGKLVRLCSVHHVAIKGGPLLFGTSARVTTLESHGSLTRCARSVGGIYKSTDLLASDSMLLSRYGVLGERPVSVV